MCHRWWCKSNTFFFDRYVKLILYSTVLYCTLCTLLRKFTVNLHFHCAFDVVSCHMINDNRPDTIDAENDNHWLSATYIRCLMVSECRSKISAYLHSKTHPKKNADAYWIMDGSSKNNDAIDEEDRDAWLSSLWTRDLQLINLLQYSIQSVVQASPFDLNLKTPNFFNTSIWYL